MKTRNKNIYRALLLISFLGVNAALLFGIGAVWVYMNSGADKTSILHIASETEDTYLPDTEWRNLENPGRPMESQTLQDIERDYIRSWYVRSIAFDQLDPYGLKDYYTDSLYRKLTEIIKLNKDQDTRISLSTLNHHLSLEFYSLDGKLVVFTDTGMEWFQEIRKGEQKLASGPLISSYRVMMLLEDGFWRVRHMEEIPNPSNGAVPERITGPASIGQIKGLNYYPARSPWDTFGDDFDPKTLAGDFEKVSAMGLNTLRVFIPYEDFGAATVKPEKLQKLVRLMDLADEAGLKVLVTLFDFYGNYDLADWTRTHRHAETLVGALKEHPALLGWDIKNEPDLDFKSRGRAEVMAWLEEMVRQVKKWDKVHPLTIGWSSPAAADNLHERLDFVSYHFYEDPDMFVSYHEKLQEKIGDKQVVISEIGFSSYSGIWNFFTGSEESQVDYYQKMVISLQGENLPFLSWTLYDFDQVPAEVVGRLPWRKAPQRHFGLIDNNGREKPAFGALVSSSQK
ncbi:cellulase family glycosylhydrolase [Muriicola marianensis]|uniref:Glycosyl hydrolase family 5 n=1 Tax=Muriicola marianensis TaxID=1324801 RepID=A0ABQ1QRU5_9FLAO|nr:cellulase family glycosylhydrolase [Muriicola marianensis]GGD41599.1 glycosyl hydrolase family 5 [Muriicola marianensis]